MKHTNKILGTMLFALAVTTSCVDDDKLEFAFEKPASIAGMEYLADYNALKSYTNPKASPNFKLGVALEASDYTANGLVTRLANSNFMEITAGNAMKMASCVSDKGEMNFSDVDGFIAAAEENGMSVYGHTLAWHAQQPVKWLNNLIKDKELDIDPDAKLEKLVTVKSYEDAPDGPFPHYPMGCEPPIINGALHYEPNGGWNQFFIFPGGENQLAEGDYLVRLYMTADKDMGSGVQLTAQNGWGGDAQNITVNIDVKAGKQVYELKYPAIAGGNYDCILKPQTADVTLDVAKIEFYKLESPAVEVEQEVRVKTYTDGPFPFYPMGCEPPVINGALHYESNGNWNQFFCFPGGENPLEQGDYVVYLDIQANKDAGGIQFTMQNGWGGDAQNMSVNMSVKAGRQSYKLAFPGVEGGNYDCIFKPQTADVTIDLYSVTVCQVLKLNSIPLTPEEKKDTLTWAMDQWISGMMEACNGRVKAWDVVNEAISGGEPDAEGVYALQHGTPDNKNDFFWQDYLGDLDYVRTAVALAREYGPQDVKLFINDYNLETAYDQNNKAKSLVAWIKRWEADGKTKIDGIGSQMHVSYQMDPARQKANEEAVVNMFKILAESGKLVKISELDMGIDDAAGQPIKTENLTEEQHKAMSAYYKFIISKYFEIIPQAQQYGICQWCITDAPANSGWRGGSPVGLWDQNYNRKHAYAGFADGLSGK